MASIFRVSNQSPYFGETITLEAATDGIEPLYARYKYTFTGSSGSATNQYISGNQGSTYSWKIPLSWVTDYCGGNANRATYALSLTCELYNSSNVLRNTETISMTVKGFSTQAVTLTSTASVDVTSSKMFNISHYGTIDEAILTYSFRTISNASIVDTENTSYTWTLPTNTLLAACTDAKSGTVSVTANLYSDGVKVKTETAVSFTVTIPSSYAPTISVTISEGNTARTQSGISVYLEGVSKITAAGTCTAKNGASIVRYAVTIDGTTYTDTTSPWSVTSGTIAAKATGASRSVSWSATATDSRGYTATATGSVTVYKYSRPQITTSLTAQRCDSSGQYQSDGTLVKVSFAGKYTIVGGNTFTVKTSYKPKSSSGNYTDTANSYTVSSDTVTASNVIQRNSSGNITFPNTTAYYVQLTLADKLYSTTAVVTVPTLKVLLDFRSDGNGLGIGMINQNAYAIDSAWSYNGSNMRLTGNIGATVNGWYEALRVSAASGYSDTRANFIVRADNAIHFTEYTTAGSDPRENYLLPAPTSTNASGDWYDILTTKNTVTVAQGGTGATTAPAALTNLGAVAKVGDTMTGRLTQKIGSWDNTTAPSADEGWDARYVADGNDRGLMFERIHQTAANAIGVEWGVRRQISSSTTYFNALRLNVASDGTRSVAFTDAAAWRTGLELGSMATASTSSYLPISGGTLTGALGVTGALSATGALSIGGRLALTGMTDSTYQSLLFVEGTTRRLEVAGNADHSIMLVERAAGSSYYEAYYTPKPTTTTAHKYYDFVTTKFFQRGTVAASSVSANTGKSSTVTFSQAYTNAPTVVATPYGAGAGSDVSVGITAVTTTNFSYTIYNATSSAKNVGMTWMAFGS